MYTRNIYVYIFVKNTYTCYSLRNILLLHLTYISMIYNFIISCILNEEHMKYYEHMSSIYTGNESEWMSRCVDFIYLFSLSLSYSYFYRKTEIGNNKTLVKYSVTFKAWVTYQKFYNLLQTNGSRFFLKNIKIIYIYYTCKRKITL